MNSIRTFFQGSVGVRILKNFPLILAILTTLFFSLGGWGQVLPSTSQTDYSVASGTWTVPAGVYSITVKCYGAGGGGGGAASSGAGSGGGGGAFASDATPLAVTPGQSIVVTVGSGGSAGNNGPGGIGGFSSVTYNSVVYVKAAGGNAGNGGASSPTSGGTGGSIASSVGSIKYAGGNGGNGTTGTWDNSGSGGGGAGTTANGSNGVSGTGGITVDPIAGGAGGSVGGGTGGTGRAYNNTGFRVGGNGVNYGGGGGGGIGYLTSGGNGGTGANGAVLLTYTVCSVAISSQPSTTIQDICLNGASTPLSITATGSPTYQWYSNTVSANSGGTLISGATSSSYTPPTNIAGTKYYYCILSGACSMTSTVSGAVNVNVAGIATSGSTNLCPGGSITLTGSASGATSYLWTTGASTASITVSPTSTTNYSVTINGACGSLTGNVTVNVSPALNFTATVSGSNIWNNVGSVQTVNLNAFPTSGSVILSEGFNSSQCVGSNSFSGLSPTCSNGLNSTWVLPSGSWTASVNTTATDYGVCTDPPPILTTTSSDTYMQGQTALPWEGSSLVSFNSCYTKGGNFATLTSPSFSTVGYTGAMVDFYMLMTANNAVNTEHIEISYSTDGTTFTNFSPNYTRKPWNCNTWEQFSCQLPAAAANKTNVWVRFKFISGQNCDLGGTAGNNLDIDLVRITGTTAPGGYGFYSYSWTEYNSPTLGIVNPAAQSTSTVAYTGSATGSKYWTCTITDGYGCVSTATTGNVNLNVQSNASSGAGTTLASPSTVCPGGGSTLSFTQSGAGNIQWESSTTSATVGFTSISGATSATYNATNITQTTWYRVRLSGMVYSNGLCSPPNFYSTVAVVTVAVFNPGIIQNAGETVSCGGDPAPFGFATLPSGGTYTYQWYSQSGTVIPTAGSTTGWTPVTTAITPNSSTPFLWSDNFDGVNNWSVFGNFAVGAPGFSNTITTPYSASKVLGTVLNGSYTNSMTEASNYAISPVVNLLGVQSPVLTYYSGSRFGSGDAGKVYISIDNGVTWGSAIETVTGNLEAAYTQHSVAIPSAANMTQVKIMFTMYSDAAGTNRTGWNIDNIAINGTIPAVNPNNSYDPPANPSSTSTYAAWVSITSGTCTYSGWATNTWVVTAAGGGTSTNWTGAALDWNWFNSANWSCGIPVCGIDANIPVVGNATYPKIDNANGSGASCKNITIASGASLETVGTANLDVCGNWVKDGTYSYNTGKISMVGTVAQTMSPATSFYNLTINNTGAGVTISADQTVTNVLTLIDGVVTTAANRMIISNNPAANVVYSGTNPSNYSNSWINGNLRRSFATNTGVYDFPVGCASYSALARLTNGSLTGISVMDAYYVQTLTTATPLDPTKAIDFGTPYTSCFTDGYWFLEPSTGSVTGGNYNLKLYYNGWSSINSSYDNKYGMVKRPTSTPTSMAWSTQIPTDGAGTLNAANGSGRVFASGYAERNNMTMFSHFAIAYALGALPIELVEFNGKYADRFNLLEWKTASEHNNDYFTLEGSSNGQDWTKVAEMNGSGNSTDMLSYFFEDYKYVQNSFNYYRLSQTDFDGTVKMAGNVISIDNRNNVRTIVRMTNILGQDVSPNAKGMLIYIYDDGSQEKVYIE